ncbi:response regulator [bacterium]|nr:response regulator [bacterium]
MEAVSTAAIEPKEVLVVDDDPILVKTLGAYLKRAGYRVRTASHGLEALQRVKAHKPDIILLDVLMPMLDGFKVARMLKFDRNTRDIPIIVITSRATENERNLGAQVGADEYMTKPYKISHVLQAVARHLNN